MIGLTVHNIHKNINKKQNPVDPNWQKELANSFNSPESLLTYLGFDAQAFTKDNQARDLFALRVPRFFADLMTPNDIDDPLLKQVMPVADEFIVDPDFSTDPLEEQQSSEQGMLHKYHNRVLLMVRGGCAVNCRYCFRRHFPYGDHHNNKADWLEVFKQIGSDPNIDEVILSGGDPLMANDDYLSWMLQQINLIPNVKRVRIHSRLPVVLPYRITEQFVQLCHQAQQQIIMVLHINHPQEISVELADKVELLIQAGVSVLNQAVMLRGINDSSDTQIALNEALFSNRIQPYYLHLFDRVQGAAHFAISDERAVAIMQDVIAKQSGYMVPKLVREIGGEASKTPVDLGLYDSAN
ncbi:MAG: EF-P beta-lysylation protein EpmB [Glaciecola sp.]|jgi:EF-P beta-lysylation protein EpmB|nr:EF-P beta-lysylation protein EpmB [Glaciecola sp.]MDG1815333.1 EF-P beta-lysylation protein EpmB [Glaciecola sp.]MDG2099944.1 EF-P beta-lysylation protein EpmB [Glaciecola sp.]